jgi:DNA repair photolyase
VATTVFFGPVLPYFSDSDEQIATLLAAVRKTGCRRVLIDKLNYLGQKIKKIGPQLRNQFPEALPAYERVLQEPSVYSERLRERALRALTQSGLEGRVIF